MKERPRKVAVPQHEDERGRLWPIELDEPASRFYIAENWENLGRYVRAWHGHPKEWRLVKCLYGAAKVCFLDLHDHTDVAEFTLGDTPDVLYMPPGWALGWMNLSPYTRLMFASPAHYAERDDVRLDPSIRPDVWMKA